MENEQRGEQLWYSRYLPSAWLGPMAIQFLGSIADTEWRSTKQALYEGSRTFSLSCLWLPDLNIMPLQLTTCLVFFLHFDLKKLIKNLERWGASPYPPGPSSGLWLWWRLGKIFGGGTKEEVPFAISPSATTQHAPSLGYWRQQPRLQFAHRMEASCTLYLVFLRHVYQ